ncbi:hypothetical protein [Umezawaea sp. Da 62-37]|uniref:hypothetical protein n=1 Tax=Umezawaea sp. Da 62-37 TaxID=3075927 RepID=UPI0028F701B4|nr:hypothetical protein [Umezawaea sp. Da 62-37]WNV86957.1 hypothetical protein RM788_01310 [Umezawaea sp. Da 62-37]
MAGKGAPKTKQTRKLFERFGKLQWAVFLIGVFHVVTVLYPLFPFDTSGKLLRFCTGFLGIVMARRWDHARRFGIALLVGYGGLVFAELCAPETLEPVTLIYGRTALSGAFIILLSFKHQGRLGT